MSSSPTPPEHDDRLTAVLEQARTYGFLGPGPVADHLAHARGFAAAASEPRRRCADLGSGGGVPALALAIWWPSTSWVLIEAMHKRADFLHEAAVALELTERVEVDERRAEEVGRDPSRRGSFDLVTARSFGPPAVTAECAAPLLATGGRLVVSEPPVDGDRWSGAPELRLSTPTFVGRFAVLTQQESCSDRYPRRVGVPTKRPLW